MKIYSLLVEFIGTMCLIIVVFTTRNFLAIGLTLSLIIFLGKMISKVTAINPTVAIAFYLSGELDKITIILYLIAEILGGLFGFFLFNTFIKNIVIAI